MTRLQHLLLGMVPLSYLVGSIPFGLLVARTRGIDPRTAGSGNIGATNIGRLLGGKFFALVFTLDLLKSLIPMLIAGLLVHLAARGLPTSTTTFLLWLLVGFAAVMGHMFSVFIGFKGGKGVATSAGLLLGLYPYFTLPGLLAIALWFIVFYLWRYVSLASILGTASFPIAYLLLALALHWPIFHQQLPLLLFALLVAGLIILKHRSNISRLLAGTEHSFRKTGPKPSSPQ
jgi:glycerol-3-phosphate acyltransferase PlsY